MNSLSIGFGRSFLSLFVSLLALGLPRAGHGQAPHITLQPQSDTAITSETVSFSVAATGKDPLAYYWSFNGRTLSDGGRVSGSRTATLTLVNILAADAGTYKVIVSNRQGTVVSTPASLTVLEPPTLTSQPQDKAALVGASASFSGSATGTPPLAYQWFFENAPLADNSRIGGATAPLLTLLSLQTNQAGHYWLRVTNIAGAATSRLAQLEVLVPPTILTPPRAQRVIQDNPALFTVQAAGTPPLMYQWYFNGSAKAGATTSSYWVPAAQPADTGSYTVLVSNRAGFLTSPAAVLDVVIPPAITGPPADLALPPGVTARFNATVTGSPQLAFRWQKDGVNLVDGGRVSGSFSSNLVITAVQAADIGGYRLVVTNLAGMAVSPEVRLAIIPLAAWGDSSYGQTNLPAGATNVVAIATGNEHSLALRADGTAIGWGYNYDGEASVPADATNLMAVAAGVYHTLGLRADGTVVAWGTGSYDATVVPGSVTNVVAIAAGNCNSLALRADGTVVAWGANYYGQGSVPAGATNVVAVAAGWYHSLALQGDGTVAAWGADFHRQASVPAEATNVVAIAAGAYHSLALRADGTAVVWGNNTYGQATVPAAATNLVAVAGGAYHSLALRADGTVLAWGDNTYGQRDIPAGATNVLAIAAGGYYSLVLLREPAAQTPPKLWQQPLQRLAAGGDDLVFAAAASGSLPLQYQWLFEGAPLAGQTRTWLGVTNVSPDQAGVYQLRAANAFGSVTGTVATLEVEDPVRILFQPASQAVALHGSASFTAAVAGTRPLWLQWLKDGVPLADNGRISGAATTNLVLTNVEAGDAGQYSLSVSNAYGNPVSDPATLRILFPPEIVSQPASQWVLAGSNVTFTVVATGTEPLGYQWYYSGLPLADNAIISGATTASLSISNAQPSAGGEYSVTVTNAAGFALSAPATLVVVDPARIVSQPASRSVAVGFPVDFSVSATGTEPLAYQWQLNGVDIPGATNVALHLGAAGPADFGDYRVLVSNPAGTVASQPATLTLSPVAAWARNDLGQTILPPGLSNVVAVSAGLNHSLALAADGTVAAWGYNNYGQINVPSTLSNVVAIVAGHYHSLALSADGTVAAWGYNNYGQTNVPSTLSNVVAIAAGNYHNLALRADGVVVGWGYNSYGQTTPPVGLRNVVAITAGTYSSLAVRADGTVAYWGTGSYGLNQVPAGLNNAVGIAAGYDHCLAVRTDGRVSAWGYNYYGQTNVPAGLTNAVAIAAGNYYSLALRADGRPAIWGRNTYGQTNVPAWLTNLVAVAGGDGHNLGLVSDGRPVLLRQPVGGTFFTGRALALQARAAGAGTLAYQWQRDGVDIAGATGATLVLSNLALADEGNYQVRVTNALGSALSQPAPITLRDRVAPFLISGLPLRQTNNMSSRLVLGLSIGGSGPLAYQWRLNNQNLPGATNEELVLDPLKRSDAGTYSLLVSNAYGSILAPPDTLRVLEVKVWGVGRGSYPYYYYDTPLNVSNVTAVACGLYQYAALRADGMVVTWGQKESGYPPGYGSMAVSNAIAIAAGDGHYLAIRRDRTVVSWFTSSSYYYNYGQTNVPAGLENVVGIAGGAYHSLALRGEGTVAAWGYNNNGQTNIPASATNVVAIAAGSFHSLALRADGTIVGWGQNNYGQAGGPMIGNTNFVAIAAGYQHSLGLRANGTVAVWGGNTYGQLNAPAGLSNAVAIAAGTYNCAALRADGTVVSWGTYYDQGQVAAPAELAYVSQIAAGGDSGVALFGRRAPSFTLQPWSRTVYRGSNVTFVAKAAGVQPVQYQWLFNGAPIPGATTDALALTNVQFAESGGYQLLATNVYGAASVTAKLMVTLPLAQALDTTNLAWTSSGSAPWYGQGAESRDGVDAARSGAVGNGQQSVLQTTVIGPGTVSWWWKVSSEEDFDTLEFQLGGFTQAAISGEVDWEQRSCAVPPGPQTLQWRYAKDGTLNDGFDAAWVDMVVYSPAPPVLTLQPSSRTVHTGESVYWSVNAVGAPPLSYQWFKDALLIPGQTASTFYLTNATRRTGGAYTVQVSNPGGATLSSNAVLRVLVAQHLGALQFLPDGGLVLTSGDADGGLLEAADLAGFEAQASTNLVQWVPLPGGLTVTNGFLQLADPEAGQYPARFYRLVEH